MKKKYPDRLVHAFAEALYQIRPLGDEFQLQPALACFAAMEATRANQRLLEKLITMKSPKDAGIDWDLFRSMALEHLPSNTLDAVLAFEMAVQHLPHFTDILELALRRLHAKYGVDLDGFVLSRARQSEIASKFGDILRKVKGNARQLPAIVTMGERDVGSVALVQLRCAKQVTPALMGQIPIMVCSNGRLGMALAIAQVSAWMARFPIFGSLAFCAFSDGCFEDVFVVGENPTLKRTTRLGEGGKLETVEKEVA